MRCPMSGAGPVRGCRRSYPHGAEVPELSVMRGRRGYEGICREDSMEMVCLRGGRGVGAERV